MKHLKTFKESVASSRRYAYNFLKMDDNLVQILHSAEDEGLEVVAGMTFQSGVISDMITICMPYQNGEYNFSVMSEQQFKSICDTIKDRLGELYNVGAGDYKTKRGIPCEYSLHIYKDVVSIPVNESKRWKERRWKDMPWAQQKQVEEELPVDEINDILNIARDEGFNVNVDHYEGSFRTASISPGHGNPITNEEAFMDMCKGIEERLSAIACVSGKFRYTNRASPYLVGYNITYWV